MKRTEYISDWKGKPLKCAFCGEDKAVKYRIFTEIGCIIKVPVCINCYKKLLDNYSTGGKL